MPAMELDTRDISEVEVDAVVVFAVKNEREAQLLADAARLGEQMQLGIADELAAIRFDGDLGAVARIPTRGRLGAELVLVVGLGARADLSLDVLRKGAGAAARHAPRNAALAVVAPGDALEGVAREAVVQAVGEGLGLGAYAFTAYRSKSHDVPAVERLVVLAGDGIPESAARTGLDAAAPVVRATQLARDLVNEPPGGKRPPVLAERVSEVAREAGLEVRVRDEGALAEGGFGGVLGVGQGSTAPPRFVELTYAPADSDGHVVLVGKGITFDSGGLSLKPTQSMVNMKSDMSGAAAIVGAMSVLGEVGVRTKVTGLLALAENMPSGHAIRVSDVITHRGGKTVEVMNTDAEGRLVMADALAYGTELKPDAMIDLATLTGAQIVALGSQIAALMSTDDGLADALLAAAEDTGERVWRLPLPADYAEQLKSEVADLKNIGKPGQAGAITAALFLREFVGDVPWAHLDIAGPAFSEEGDAFYTAKGGTGMGVRTLIRFLQRRSRKG